jgi:hypothetical protein
MVNQKRRDFLADVGRGMLIGSLGPTLAAELGLARLNDAAGAEGTALTFGELEPLVALMQETPAAKLQPLLVEKLKSGTGLNTLVAAAALANARTFGGQDYIGFHTFMALAPAYEMSKQLPEAQRPLPVLKVLYRNASRMEAVGGRSKEVLAPVEAADLPTGTPPGELLRQATRSGDFDSAERTFAAIARGPVGEAFNHLQFAVEDEVDVHRVVLAWRAWMTLDITGPQHAHSLLRQSVRYCVNSERYLKDHNRAPSAVRELLPKLLDQYKLLEKEPGRRRAEDAWVEKTARLIANSSPAQAAEAAAAALAEGIASDDVAEALALAANELVLRDPGRPKEWASDVKPVGSVHGDSVGVHASDSANAWRNIARVSNRRNAVASLIVGAFHTGGQYSRLNAAPFPLPDQLEKITATDPQALVAELHAAVKEKDQFRASALVHRYGQLGHAPQPVFEALLGYATSEDGALHAEKYYLTVREEFALTRPSLRWRQLVALARVTSSEYGRTAPGYDEARELLKV